MDGMSYLFMGSLVSSSLAILAPIVGTFVLMDRSCAHHIVASFWTAKVVQAIEEMDNGLKKETKSGWKDNTTSILRKEVATRSRRRENSRVVNQQT
jgi:hypothetical protein